MRTMLELCPRCGGDVPLRTDQLDQLARCGSCGSVWRAFYSPGSSGGLWRSRYTMLPLGRPSAPERVRAILGRVIDQLLSLGRRQCCMPETRTGRQDLTGDEGDGQDL